MSFKLYTVLTILLSIDSVHLALHSTGNSLKLIQIVQRHGDRTPTNFYTNDPYADPSHWPDGIGQLTRAGKTRMYEFGRVVRHKYDNYLSFSPREVYARSSSSARCLESAEAFMAGLYRPNGYWTWNNDSNSNASLLANEWQPIAIDTVSSALDGLLVTTADCPNADKVWQQVMQSSPVVDYLSTRKEFIIWLSNKTGDEYWTARPSTLRPLEFLSTTLRVERENGLQMPDWADNSTVERLRDLELHAFYFDWMNGTIQRLRAGLLLSQISQNMLSAANDASANKLYVFETHDVLLVVLMQALGVYDQLSRTPPTYGASLVFETHSVLDHTFVKLLYYANNESIDDFLELRLSNCNHANNDANCSLDQFVESVQQFIPTDWQIECGLKSQSNDNSIGWSAFAYFLCGVGVGFVGMCLIVIFYLLCAANSRPEENNKLIASKYSE